MAGGGRDAGERSLGRRARDGAAQHLRQALARMRLQAYTEGMQRGGVHGAVPLEIEQQGVAQDGHRRRAHLAGYLLAPDAQGEQRAGVALMRLLRWWNYLRFWLFWLRGCQLGYRRILHRNRNATSMVAGNALHVLVRLHQ